MKLILIHLVICVSTLLHSSSVDEQPTESTNFFGGQVSIDSIKSLLLSEFQLEFDSVIVNYLDYKDCVNCLITLKNRIHQQEMNFNDKTPIIILMDKKFSINKRKNILNYLDVDIDSKSMFLSQNGELIKAINTYRPPNHSFSFTIFMDFKKGNYNWPYK